MVPNNYTEFIDGLTYLVKNNFVPMSRIDDAVKRILRVKFVMGLFENPLADYSMAKYLGSNVRFFRFLFSVFFFFLGEGRELQIIELFCMCNSNLTFVQEHRELAREAVRKSLVLLKNGANADEPVLPLPKKTSRILVAGTHADNIGYQNGGWTITWQGVPGNSTVGKFLIFPITLISLVKTMKQQQELNQETSTSCLHLGLNIHEHYSN